MLAEIIVSLFVLVGAFALMGMLVGRVGSTRASFTTYLIPVVAMGLGVWLRGDEVGPLGVLGVGLVITGAILASRSEIRRGTLTSPEVEGAAPA